VIVMSLKCSRVPGSTPFPFIIIPSVYSCPHYEGLSIVKFMGVIGANGTVKGCHPLVKEG
jgi:hypothetical protein